MVSIPTVTLNDGHEFPQLGLGTYSLQGEDGIAAIAGAIDSGYRLIDSAVNYENETEVGEAVRRVGVDRDALTITTKLPGRDHGYDETIASAEGSLARLGLDRIDLYLIHWPNPSVGKYVDTFRAMVDLRETGRVRSIGVSNFTATMLDEVVDATGVTPAVNQVELHPYFPQDDLRAAHERLGIRTESWSPLGKRSELLTEPVLLEIAEARGISANRIVLRWHIQLGSTPIPKSGDAHRQVENADVFGFELSDEEMSAISSLRRGRLWGADPETHEEM